MWQYVREDRGNSRELMECGFAEDKDKAVLRGEEAIVQLFSRRCSQS